MYTTCLSRKEGEMLPTIARFTAHVALAAALSANMAAVPSAVHDVVSLVEAGTPRSSPALSAAVRSLLEEAPPPAAVDFSAAAGTWRVVSAPLIDRLAGIARTNFDIAYRIGASGTIGATVRYDSDLFGGGWLCTDGSISNIAEDGPPRVRLVWERIWWQPGGDATVPPLDPDAEGAAALKPLVQALGRAGFSEELAVFPVCFIDTGAGLAVFQWQGLTVATLRT